MSLIMCLIKDHLTIIGETHHVIFFIKILVPKINLICLLKITLNTKNYDFY